MQTYLGCQNIIGIPMGISDWGRRYMAATDLDQICDLANASGWPEPIIHPLVAIWDNKS